jgi:7-carboxy-7-deazaguanine synthase
MATVNQTLRISEVFLSLQGEGPSAGTPAHFLRLQGCGVGCHWCDTKYSWQPEGGRAATIAEALDHARSLGTAPLLVVTGGEPLEQPGLGALLEAALARWERVEVETSGITPPPLHHERLFYNVSPKLPSATPRSRDTWRHVRQWIAEPNATFKLVVGDPPDLDDALAAVAEHAIPPARVMLMPEGMTDQALRARAAGLAEACKRHGFRLSPRLHVWMWGARRGV